MSVRTAPPPSGQSQHRVETLTEPLSGSPSFEASERWQLCLARGAQESGNLHGAMHNSPAHDEANQRHGPLFDGNPFPVVL